MDMTLREKLLPAALICKGFINIDDSNYENYLLEIINASKYFMEKSGGEKYQAPIEESNGECDCNSAQYSVDFKLAASETAMRGRNLFSDGIYCLAQGVVAHGGAKIEPNNPDYKPIQATRLHAAMRCLSIEELKEIKLSKDKKQGINTDIRAFLETLETKKNIFLFFPYEFFTDEVTEFEDKVIEITEAINKDFAVALSYRKELLPKYDTYLMFIYAGYFVITQYNKNKLEFIEAIEEKYSPTYLNLKSYVEWL